MLRHLKGIIPTHTPFLTHLRHKSRECFVIKGTTHRIPEGHQQNRPSSKTIALKTCLSPPLLPSQVTSDWLIPSSRSRSRSPRWRSWRLTARLDARTHQEPALSRWGLRNSAAFRGSSRLSSDPKGSGRGNGGRTHSACRDGSALSVQPRSVDPGGRHTRFAAHDYPARHAGSAAVRQCMAAF